MQSIKKNLFEFFGLSESYDLDIEKLSERYHELQKEFHPDKNFSETEAEKMRSVQLASFANEAYETLRSPLKRAAYILTIRGYDAELVDQSDLGMDLLIEQMRLRETLEDLPKDESALPGLEKLKKEVKEKLRTKQSNFASDAREENFVSAKKTFHELQFLYKLMHEIEENEELRLDY